MNEKQVSLANFNCTFGVKEEPMLNYLEEFVLPAFTSGIVREISEDTEFFLENVKLIEFEPEKFALAGLIVKSTVLEVKSKREDGKLKLTDFKYPADPFSIFIIFLENHRMVLVKNQKGSPDLRSFSATVKYIMRKYQVTENGQREKENKLPFARLNVVDLPSLDSIAKKLEDVKKIKRLIMKIYPTNGDFDFNDTIDGLLEQLENVGGNTSSYIINSPTQINNVGQLISDTQGIVKSKLEVVYKSGSTGNITNKGFSDNFKMKFELENNIEKDSSKIIELVKFKDQLFKVSPDNSGNYKRKIPFLKQFINK
ncbi:hypothetical protein [Clostridium sp.]|uniref:hypothetical protein n=1 Tax=Clostridium sp. TaxID=1506 RepID=UPI002FC7FB28